MRCIWLKSDSQQANFNYYFNNVTYITSNFLFSFQTHHCLNKTPAPVHSISMWPPPNLWSVSYTTCRSSPDQRGMAMVRRRRVREQGLKGGPSQAQGMGGIWALLMAEGWLLRSLQVGQCWGCSWGDWAMERVKGKKWAMWKLVQSCSDGKDAE